MLSFRKPRVLRTALASIAALGFANVASAERVFGPRPYDVTGVSEDDPVGLVMRSGPGPSYKQVGTIPYNADRVYLSDCEHVGKAKWCYAKYGFYFGWVNYRYLKLDSSQPSAPAQEADVHNGDPAPASSTEAHPDEAASNVPTGIHEAVSLQCNVNLDVCLQTYSDADRPCPYPSRSDSFAIQLDVEGRTAKMSGASIFANHDYNDMKCTDESCSASYSRDIRDLSGLFELKISRYDLSVEVFSDVKSDYEHSTVNGKGSCQRVSEHKRAF